IEYSIAVYSSSLKPDSAPALTSNAGWVRIDIGAFLPGAVLERVVRVLRQRATTFAVLANSRDVVGAYIGCRGVIESVVRRSAACKRVDGEGPVGRAVTAWVVIGDQGLEENRAAQLRHVLYHHFALA